MYSLSLYVLILDAVVIVETEIRYNLSMNVPLMLRQISGQCSLFACDHIHILTFHHSCVRFDVEYLLNLIMKKPADASEVQLDNFKCSLL